MEWKGVFLGGDAIERDSGFVGEDFILLTGGASFHIVRNPFVHSYPLQLLLGFSDCLIPTWVSCCGVVMHKGHEGSLG